VRGLFVSLLAITAMVGCGAASQPVPDVVGERLDVAKGEVSDAGYDTEEVGGGMFGIVDESNWTVCETRPASGVTGGGKVKLIVERSCASNSGSQAEESDAADDTEATEAAAAAPVHKKARTHRKAKLIRVPNVVGLDHQLAQDTLQAAGLYMLAERDATGQGRLLLWDRNWTVVRQSPKAGRRVGENRRITLFSVKDGER
jgi:beta-lactam-binding protein with PASTA domain